MPYFVTVVRSFHPLKWAALDGPYDTREEAAEHVDEARRWMQERDPWADFDSFGVSEHPATIPTPHMRRQA